MPLILVALAWPFKLRWTIPWVLSRPSYLDKLFLKRITPFYVRCALGVSCVASSQETEKTDRLAYIFLHCFIVLMRSLSDTRLGNASYQPNRHRSWPTLQYCNSWMPFEPQYHSGSAMYPLFSCGIPLSRDVRRCVHAQWLFYHLIVDILRGASFFHSPILRSSTQKPL